MTAGRRSMAISTRAATKKIEKEPERDEEAENMLKYLGEVAIGLIEQKKKNDKASNIITKWLKTKIENNTDFWENQNWIYYYLN